MIRDQKCPTCLSPCQMNVAAIKQVAPYAKFLVRAAVEKRALPQHRPRWSLRGNAAARGSHRSTMDSGPGRAHSALAR